MPKRYPVIYVLNPIGIDGALEATDVLHFCSEECRQTITENTAHTIKAGESADWIEGTVCDECGVRLVDEVERERREDESGVAGAR